ncbi:MAG: site-specific DNA-methyltransferase [Rickettsiales bacterium]|jgi:site-specific DNA-methyltransferase (adenine-specific)|nr:site-specific DNA-methyltransferase [Rickettsiales bacterium]
MYYNCDCVEGSKKYLKDNSIDLIITDPPYGIEGDKLDKHYNRDESKVIDGYVDIPLKEYANFSNEWIKEAERVLKPSGNMYIISGYTNLRHILNALANTKLQEINHIIWKYNFGVHTSKKYVSSHYHILYYAKPPTNKKTFNTNAFYGDNEKDERGSLNYRDREDVWVINREYKPNEVKNKNQLPNKLLEKMLLYSSNQNDLVCDFFAGSFSTCKVALGLGRNACGFEINKNAFVHQMREIEKIKFGELLDGLKKPQQNKNVNAGKPLEQVEIDLIMNEYQKFLIGGLTKKSAIERVGEIFGRGYWSIEKMLKKDGEIEDGK